MQRLLIHMQNTVQLRQPVRSTQYFNDTSLLQKSMNTIRGKMPQQKPRRCNGTGF